MSALHSEVFEAFRSTDIPEDKALRAAAVLSLRDDTVADLGRDVAGGRGDISTLKGDVAVLKADVAALKADMVVVKADVTTLKVDMVVVKADITLLKSDMAVLKWMMGFVLAFQVLIFGKMFIR